MQKNIINRIPVYIRIRILILIILMLFISKSLFLMLFITILVLIILILTNRNIKKYIEHIIKDLILLLLISVIYIIIYGLNAKLIILVYKIILLILLLRSFIISVDFYSLYNGIYYLFQNFKISNSSKIAFNLTIYIYFCLDLITIGNKIKKLQSYKDKHSYTMKNFLLPKLILSVNNISNLEINTKLRFYNAREKNKNVFGNILLLFFLILFIIVLFKEVIS